MSQINIIPDEAVRYGGLWQRSTDAERAGELDPMIRAILFKQLAEKGMPPIHLPRLHAPSGFCVRSERFGFNDAPVRMVVLRHEHHAKLIAEADSKVRGQVSTVSIPGDITTTVAEYLAANDEAVH